MSTPPAAPPAPAAAPQASTEGAPKGSTPPAGTATPAPGTPPAAPPAAPPPAKPGEAAPPPAPAAPPAGEVKFNLKLPDGSKVTPEHAKTIEDFAKANGLTEKQAQAQLDRESKALADAETAQKAELAAKNALWKKTTVEHPELGGQNLPRTTKRCAAALSRFDPDGKLKAILDASGIGDLPEVVAYQERVGASLESDRFVAPPTVPPSAEPKKDKDVFYS